MANLKRVVSYIVPHTRNRFTGAFTTHSRLQSLTKASSFPEVGTVIYPQTTISPPYYTTLCSNDENLFNNRRSIPENCDNAQKVCEDTAVTYETNIKRLINMNQIDTAVAMLQEMVEKGFQPDMVTYAMAIDSLFTSVVGGEDRALKLLKELAFSRGIHPNPYWDPDTYSSLLHAIRILSRREDISKLLMDMDDKGILASPLTYNIFVDAYAKEGRLEVAESLVKYMIRYKIHRNSNTYLWLIDAYCLQGNMSKSRELFDSMGMPASVAVYNSLIKGYFWEAKIEEAMDLFYELMNNRVKHLAVTYGTKGLFRVAGDTHNKNKSFNSQKPNKYTYKIVLEGLCNNNQVEEAVSLFHSIDDMHSYVNIDLYNILIYGAGKKGKLRTAKILYNNMVMKGLKPNAMTYAAIIIGFCKGGSRGEAKELYLEMKEKNFEVTNEMYEIILRGCWSEYELKEMLIKEFNATGVPWWGFRLSDDNRLIRNGERKQELGPGCLVNIDFNLYFENDFK